MKPISPSRVLSYMFCPRSYTLQYDMRIPSILHPKAKEGLKVHKACEAAQKNNCPPDLQEPFLGNFNSTLRELKIGEKAITEVRLQGELEGIPIIGVIDLLDIDQGIVLDWKTGKENKSFVVQGYLYAALTREHYGFWPRVFFSYLRTGVLHQLDVDELRAGKKLFQKFINRKEKAPRSFDPINGQCRACGYQTVCGMSDESLRMLGR